MHAFEAVETTIGGTCDQAAIQAALQGARRCLFWSFWLRRVGLSSASLEASVRRLKTPLWSPPRPGRAVLACLTKGKILAVPIQLPPLTHTHIPVSRTYV